MDICEVVKNWSLQSYKITNFLRGYSNPKWMFECNKKKYVLRNTGIDLKYTLSQVKVLNHLCYNSFSYESPRLIFSKDHKEIVESNGYYFYLYEYIEGFSMSEKIDEKITENIGKLVGEYSKCISSLELPKNSTVVSVLENISLDNFKIISKEIGLEIYNKAIDNIYEQDFSSLREMKSIPCHSDLKPRNFLTIDLRTPKALIDFGSICVKPKICDVSNCIKNLFDIYRNKNISLFYRFLEGYSLILSREEKRLIYPIMVDDLVKEIYWHYRRIKNNGSKLRERYVLNRRVKLLESLLENPIDFSSV